jgi:hypothetical protein
MSSYFNKTKCVIHNEAAEDALKHISGEYDLIFTSPPYFDKEIYAADESQSYVRYPDYKKWLFEWLIPVCSEACLKLSLHGRFALSIGKSDEHDVAADFLSSFDCMKLSRTIIMETPVISYQRKNGAKKNEYVYVFEKW